MHYLILKTPKTPKGLTVNVRCSSYLADYSNVKAKFTETKGRAESEFSESHRLHYRTAAQRLNSEVQEIEKARQDITKVSNKRDRDEHNMYFKKSNDNIINILVMFAAVRVEAVARHKGVVNTRNAEFQVSMCWCKLLFCVWGSAYHLLLLSSFLCSICVSFTNTYVKTVKFF